MGSTDVSSVGNTVSAAVINLKTSVDSKQPKLPADVRVTNYGGLLFYKRRGVCTVWAKAITVTGSIALPAGFKSPDYLVAYGRPGTSFVINGLTCSYVGSSSNDLYATISYVPTDD